MIIIKSIYHHFQALSQRSKPVTRQDPYVLEHPHFFKNKNQAFLLTCGSRILCENAISIFLIKPKKMYQLLYLFIKLFIYLLVHPLISAEAFHPTSICSGHSCNLNAILCVKHSISDYSQLETSVIIEIGLPPPPSSREEKATIIFLKC